MTRTHSRCSPLATRTPKLPCTPPNSTPTPPALRPPRPPPPQPPPPPPSSAYSFHSEEGELESIGSESISVEKVREGGPSAPADHFSEVQYAALVSEATPPSVASSSTRPSIVGQFMRTVSQMERGWTEDSLSEERGARDQELPASISSIEAERQRNRGAQQRGFKQRRGSVQPANARRRRPTPTLREQERLSRLVELGLLSFGSLAFEIQRHTEVAQAAAPPPARTGSAVWVTSGKGEPAAAILPTRAVTQLVKNNAEDMTPA